MPERVAQQSAAEFFSEHQQIAGFDNAGKSLFTTIREFVENSLDAAESINVFPDIAVTVKEFTESEHNILHGINRGGKKKKPITTSTDNTNGDGNENGDDGDQNAINDTEIEKSPIITQKTKKREKGDPKELSYYEVSCKDNGCGIIDTSIGDMLGRVLSGSKHGLRQTRGKFGLGAKMALIWSKKSSGLPIHIRTAHSSSPDEVPSRICSVVLDIDIHKNEPRILKKEYEDNTEGWRGTEISVTISGNWSVYRSRCLQYFQQLAVITPYARLQLNYSNAREASKNFEAVFARRSEQMPPVPEEILPHPHSLNNITLSNLLYETDQSTTARFLSKDLNCVPMSLAQKIVGQLSLEKRNPHKLNASEIAGLIQQLRDNKSIRPPPHQCLSPAGEYNMRLGVFKELKPKMVATFSDKAGSHEGHPFLVEAAVSVGGHELREGINVYRFANRIPLLFEGGGDVSTKCANELNWKNYHIDKNNDSIGVYVSIVSTRIPFKGTSKEYIGDDSKEIKLSVKRALEGCCRQLKSNLAAKMNQKEEAERKKSLTKYIPDISRSLCNVLKKMAEKRNVTGSPKGTTSRTKDQSKNILMSTLGDVATGKITASSMASLLEGAVDRLEKRSELEATLNEASAAKKMKIYLCPSDDLSKAPAPDGDDIVITGSSSSGGDDYGGNSNSQVPMEIDIEAEAEGSQPQSLTEIDVNIVTSTTATTTTTTTTTTTATTTNTNDSGYVWIDVGEKGNTLKARILITDTTLLAEMNKQYNCS